jgi:hypothetical protein
MALPAAEDSLLLVFVFLGGAFFATGITFTIHYSQSSINKLNTRY